MFCFTRFSINEMCVFIGKNKKRRATETMSLETKNGLFCFHEGFSYLLVVPAFLTPHSFSVTFFYSP
jgi:hypothetical protein